MPHLHTDNKIWVVTKEELVPRFWNTENSLYSEIGRNKKIKGYLDKITSGGNGRMMLIDFYSLPKHVQTEIGDPNKYEHILLNFYETDQEAYDFYTSYKFPNGKYILKHTQEKYITNASVLKALRKLKTAREIERSSKGKTSTKGLLNKLCEDAISFNEFLKKHFGVTHNLPSSFKRFKVSFKDFVDDGYISLVKDIKRNSTKNAIGVKDNQQEAMLRFLFRKHNNFDNVQIQNIYNAVADQLQWKQLTSATIANYRTKWELTTYSGSKGASAFNNTKLMQHKRKGPSYPLYYWTADGWDVELLYQVTETDKKGYSKTTYHNRLTVVVILDPFQKYPVGYAIGTHETPALIQQAFRNAIHHTEELFGTKYKTLQLQTDRYAMKALLPFYNALSVKYTPAQVKNAKSKVIEPWFKYMNKKYFQLMANWSGFGVTAKKENQPNTEYLNKIRHSFPDLQGCIQQVEHAMNMERLAQKELYIQGYAEMPAEDKKTMSNEYFLYHLGETTGFTNRLSGDGLNVKILGETKTYDSFDVAFRQKANNDWCVHYDPQNLDEVLVCNAKSQNGKLIEEIGTDRFMLTEKYIQPMALRERKENDNLALKQTNEFNKGINEMVIDEMSSDQEALQDLFQNNKLEGTLAKMLLVDSMGQHKLNKANARLNTKVIQIQKKQVTKEIETSWNDQQEAYMKAKMPDLNKYLNN